MVLEISDKLMKQAGFSEKDLLLQLAIFLFREEKLTLGQAAELAKMHQTSFQMKLSEMNIPVHYSEEDYQHDKATIKDLK